MFGKFIDVVKNTADSPTCIVKNTYGKFVVVKNERIPTDAENQLIKTKFLLDANAPP